MTWWCEDYGKNILRIAYLHPTDSHNECEHCHLLDKCVADSIYMDTEVPIMLKCSDVMIIVKVMDDHDSKIAENISNQLLRYADNTSISRVNDDE